MRGPNPAPSLVPEQPQDRRRGRRRQSSETQDLRTAGQLAPGRGSGLRAGPPLQAPLFHLLPDIREAPRDPGQGHGGGGTRSSVGPTPLGEAPHGDLSPLDGVGGLDVGSIIQLLVLPPSTAWGQEGPLVGTGPPDSLPSLEPGHLYSALGSSRFLLPGRSPGWLPWAQRPVVFPLMDRTPPDRGRGGRRQGNPRGRGRAGRTVRAPDRPLPEPSPRWGAQRPTGGSLPGVVCPASAGGEGAGWPGLRRSRGAPHTPAAPPGCKQVLLPGSAGRGGNGPADPPAHSTHTGHSLHPSLRLSLPQPPWLSRQPPTRPSG